MGLEYCTHPDLSRVGRSDVRLGDADASVCGTRLITTVLWCPGCRGYYATVAMGARTNHERLSGIIPLRQPSGGER